MECNGEGQPLKCENEERQPLKCEKSSPPTKDQNSIPAYPDWVVMQAYYGPRFAIPYLNSATVAYPHGHPPYLWVPPQTMIPQYDSPCPPFYAHGGYFGYTGVPIVGTASSSDKSAKLSSSSGGGFVKKLKEFDGLAKMKGDGNADSGNHGTDQRPSESEDTGGSSDGSNRTTPGVDESSQKRSQQESLSAGNGEAKKKCRPTIAAAGGHRDSVKPIDSTKTPVEKIENVITIVSELDDPSHSNVKSPTNTPYPSMLTGDTWLQDEREVKQERRKQSNRESAKRSRLRKQAEMEELTGKVQVLTSENMTFKSEIHKSTVMCEKLRLENVALMAKLRAALKKGVVDFPRLKPDGTQNLLERVNKNTSTIDGGDSYEKRNPMTKLHQLLDPSHRTDAVAAS